MAHRKAQRGRARKGNVEQGKKRIQPHKKSVHSGPPQPGGYTGLIVAFLALLVMFVVLYALMVSAPDKGDAAARKDFAPEELLRLRDLDSIMQLDCDQLKSLLGTEKDACIYFTDEYGKIIDMDSDGSFGVGCPGLVIEGKQICRANN